MKLNVNVKKLRAGLIATILGLFIVIGFQNCGKGFKMATPGSSTGESTNPTPTPGVTPSPVVSPSPGVTPSPSPTPIKSPTPTPVVSPSPAVSPSPGVTPSPSPTPVWSINYPTADTIELTVGTGTLNLKTTLPSAYQSMNGEFSVDPTGAALPAGMTLTPAGILSVGSAAAGTSVSGVKFIFTTP